VITPTPVPTAAIILAAGKGTRMQSNTPKVMHQIGHKPMLGHVIDTAKQAGLAPITVVCADGMSQIENYAQEHDAGIAIQQNQLGTGDAVLSAENSLKQFEGNLLVLYGDTPLISAATLHHMLDCLKNDANTAAVVLGFTPDDAGSYGRLLVNADNILERIIEAHEASDAELAITFCNAGVMALRGNIAWDILHAIDNKNAKQEFYLTDAIEIIRKKGLRARAVAAKTYEVMGVNSKTELAQAEAVFQTKKREMMMASGVTLQDPTSVYFAHDTSVAADCIIEPNVFFGEGVAIGARCHIRAYSHIEGAVIGVDSVIGPFARLRAGTNISEKVRIGNFVEIKKSEIDTGAKVSHLSYIGDASIGEGANIGAGTITCNYDGYNKYRTMIGAQVFIGSNSALVAPLTIGDGAMVAAGSVITENIAPDALALARTRQEQKETWARAFRDKQKKSDAR
jgi:bifunctional UDP-N-acetylglucosamine pyrophosphorylase/glucosamine-1-phosphate N-acetyltransferase